MLDYHRMLLADAKRTLAFREALRRVVKADDVVVDLGSGSGMLAFFAAEAGARKVFAIERGHMADVIAVLAKQFRVGDRVEVLHENSEKVELPERGSVLVSEILGTFGLQEEILSMTIDARARLLAPNATIIPSRVVLSAVPVELSYDYDKHVAWWSGDHYGFDLSPLRMFASNGLFTADIPEKTHLARPAEIIDVHLATVDDSTVTGKASFDVTRDGTLHGFGGWFTATLADDVTLSNEEAFATHWQQTFLPLEQPVEVTSGTRVELELQSHDGRAWRWRGRAGETEFDQATGLSSPPCTRI